MKITTGCKSSRRILFFSILCSVLVSFVSGISYEGHKVIRISVNDRNSQLIHQLLKDTSADVWSHSTHGAIDIRIPPSALPVFQLNDVPYSILIDDVESHLSRTLDLSTKTASIAFNLEQSQSQPNSFFSKYQTLEDIEGYMSKLISTYPTLIKSTVIGKSFEGRNINAYIVSGNNTAQALSKKGFFVLGGLHAREWISPAVVSYTISRFLNEYPQNQAMKKILDYYEFHFVVVGNPDGYKYTFTQDRLWRKNRQNSTSQPTCIGLDLNRNFPYQWDDRTDSGSSTNPCGAQYRGSKPLEAPEIIAIVNYIQNQPDNSGEYWNGFIDFHSYGMLWMFPNAAQCGIQSPDYDTLAEASRLASSSIRQSTQSLSSFTSGDVCSVLYQATGSSLDWAYYSAGIMFSFAVELRDKGDNGFLLPPEQIVPSGIEVYSGITTLSNYMIDFYNNGGRSKLKSKGYNAYPSVPTLLIAILLFMLRNI